MSSLLPLPPSIRLLGTSGALASTGTTGGAFVGGSREGPGALTAPHGRPHPGGGGGAALALRLVILLGSLSVRSLGRLRHRRLRLGHFRLHRLELRLLSCK